MYRILSKLQLNGKQNLEFYNCWKSSFNSKQFDVWKDFKYLMKKLLKS